AALLVLGPRYRPGIALGAFLANATAEEPHWTAGGIAVGNTLEAVVGAWLLHRLGVRTTLDRLRDVLALILGAALASTMVSATIGAASLCHAGGDWTSFWSLWRVWY